MSQLSPCPLCSLCSAHVTLSPPQLVPPLPALSGPHAPFRTLPTAQPHFSGLTTSPSPTTTNSTSHLPAIPPPPPDSCFLTFSGRPSVLSDCPSSGLHTSTLTQLCSAHPLPTWGLDGISVPHSLTLTALACSLVCLPTTLGQPLCLISLHPGRCSITAEFILRTVLLLPAQCSYGSPGKADLTGNIQSLPIVPGPSQIFLSLTAPSLFLQDSCSHPQSSASLTNTC